MHSPRRASASIAVVSTGTPAIAATAAGAPFSTRSLRPAPATAFRVGDPARRVKRRESHDARVPERRRTTRGARAPARPRAASRIAASTACVAPSALASAARASTSSSLASGAAARTASLRIAPYRSVSLRIAPYRVMMVSESASRRCDPVLGAPDAALDSGQRLSGRGAYACSACGRSGRGQLRRGSPPARRRICRRGGAAGDARAGRPERR
ncbi:hypothetical protein [Burkholderia pseudomallei]|uniref:hypothetical protein n=1 Tax=Burkholderia pseudomallei TaxID=28450 RepID=UPI00160566C3|nr:hypothetical protein [Burkholderia pseudomallei]